MKKLKVLGVAAAAVGMISLTSCLGDGKNTSTVYGLGVVEFSMDAFGNVVTDDYGTVAYSPAFAGLNAGDYVVYTGMIDYDTQTSNKYMTVDVEQNGFAIQMKATMMSVVIISVASTIARLGLPVMP